MSLILYSQYFKKSYKQKCCSCEAIFCIISFALVIIIPYIVAYLTGSLWVKQQQYYEQAEVAFKNGIILQVQMEDGQSLMFSTLQSWNQRSMNELGVPLIKINSIDENGDDLIDEFNLYLEFKCDKDKIRNIKLFATFDYYLRNMLQIEMIGMIVLDIDTPLGSNKIISYGTLNMIQDDPVLIDSVKRTLYNVDPLVEGSDQSADLNQIYKNYMYRKERIMYDHQFIVQNYGNIYQSEINIQIKVPTQQQVKYIPGVLETLKYAWIQYLALFIPLYLILQLFLSFMFRYQILETSVLSDLQINSFKK